MLYPNIQAVTNGYSNRWVPRPFSPMHAEIWIWGWKSVYEKRRPNPIFPQDPPKIGCVDGGNGEKSISKERKTSICFNKLAVY